MIEALALIFGGVVLAAGIFALGVVMAFVGAWWETYWLHPLWAVVVVPLGLPAISFWHFFALNVFISVIWMAVLPSDYAKVADKTERVTGQTARVVVFFARPVVAFYVIRWAI